jgi:two-component system OmpR family response regulator
MRSTILIVDDDPHIRQLLVFALTKAGLNTCEASNGEEALARTAASQPDLIILDINMPRMDGLEVCRRLRIQSSRLPILFLSSRDDEIDRVVGIEIGADDYVTKPFSPREVVARVNAILRRTAGGAAPVEPVAADRLSRERLTLDLEGWVARWCDQEVTLTVTEFGILRALMTAPSKVFSRDAIIDRLHGPGFALTDRTVDSHVRNLRGKFARLGAHDVVETRAGVGYRLGPCRGGMDS